MVVLVENFRAVFYAPFYAAFALHHYEMENVEVELRTSKAAARSRKLSTVADLIEAYLLDAEKGRHRPNAGR